MRTRDHFGLKRPCVDIPGYEGMYAVRSDGVVISLARTSDVPGRHGVYRKLSKRQLRQPADSFGYPYVTLFKGGKSQKYRVHVLVLLAFVGPRPDGADARHLNGDPTDNRVANLAWGSRKENMDDVKRHGTHHLAKKTHCPEGHAYSGDNLIIGRRGDGSEFRSCRECTNANRAARRRKQKETNQ